jgi:hypothetical protein
MRRDEQRMEHFGQRIVRKETLRDSEMNLKFASRELSGLKWLKLELQSSCYKHTKKPSVSTLTESLLNKVVTPDFKMNVFI